MNSKAPNPFLTTLKAPIVGTVTRLVFFFFFFLFHSQRLSQRQDPYAQLLILLLGREDG